MNTHIPISKSTLTYFNTNNLTFYALTLLANAEKQFYSFDTNKKQVRTFLNLTPTHMREMREKYGFERQRFKDAAKQLGEMFITEDPHFICMMPLDVWKKFESYLTPLTLKQKNSISAVFLYVYWNACCNAAAVPLSGEFIAQELNMNVKVVRTYLLDLIRDDWILTDGHYFSSAKGTLSAQGKRYTIPDEIKPKEWFEYFANCTTL